MSTPSHESAAYGDELYDQAVAVVRRDRKPRISHIQRQLGIGFNRAAALMDRMEREGVVKPYVPPDPPEAA
jgi:DNA segregation ATPase FtsK/SpoIIIE-like protein